VTLRHYRISDADGAGPEYPAGRLLSVRQSDEDPDYTHWVDWGDGHFVVDSETAGQIDIWDQAIAYPLERA
jgi:hypothetical protein